MKDEVARLDASPTIEYIKEKLASLGATVSDRDWDVLESRIPRSLLVGVAVGWLWFQMMFELLEGTGTLVGVCM